MKNKMLLKCAIFIARWCWLYAPVAIVEHFYDVKAWVALAPQFFLLIPIGFYIASQRCPNCGKRIYVAHFSNKEPKALKDIRDAPFTHCPCCDTEL